MEELKRKAAPSLKRRRFLQFSSGAPLAAGAFGGAAAARRAAPAIVLVHGAWHGGWCWKYVRELLESRERRVFTPTLTGLGARKHLLGPDIGLETHISDIANLIEYEELGDVLLVGHSYAGMVVTGVADRMKDRIGHIVYLDAGVPEKTGQSFLTYGPEVTAESVPAREEALRALAPDGVAMGTFPATVLGVPPEDIENTRWVERRLTPHPLKTWFDPITLENGGSSGLPRTFVHCTAPVLQQSSIPFKAEQIRRDPSWRYLEIATGHNAMVTAPDKVAEILLAIG